MKPVVPSAYITALGVALCVGVTAWLAHVFHWPWMAAALAGAVALSARRDPGGAHAVDHRMALWALPLVAVASSEIQALLETDFAVGAALFVVVMFLSIWTRRHGPHATRAGTLVVLPMLLALIVRGPQWSSGWLRAGASVGVGVGVWVIMALLRAAVGDRGVDRPPAPVPQQAKTASASMAPRPSTRMAIQMAVAVGGAFIIGPLLFNEHGMWMVLSALVVCSGNRGRGDVLHKGLMRGLGAAAGTVVAAGLDGMFAPHSRGALIAIAATVAVAARLRRHNYAFWTAGTTAALSLFYGWEGESASSLLVVRLAAIVSGAVLAVAVSWWLLPVRSRRTR
ncbi:MAG: hypothetical protein JWQ11_3997 [Rhizobacter sp.]|nr:hypothetical protein [Rhizobacter sp.]